MTAYTYILRCSDDSFYTGSTANTMEQRVAQHNSIPGGAAYTRRRKPVTLEWYVEHEAIAEAYALEGRIHNWSRGKKQALIDGNIELLSERSRKKRFQSTNRNGRRDDI
ncbi:GIY-YIG nuclease family protein [Gordonia sp. TBRC 11910]|uniref:GIY-YIG nuclease family protein n=1 Tax=Gordonia asplenii TaxID=2725283 RepID=A0A848KXN6_9ACTN|nr:GIY-YIG nuclease family protein [Gordonia asplenii]NMO01615.1 GIY-YIG nuclease family protein [Gordonia asplenii]